MPLLPKNRDHGWAPYIWLVFLAFFFFQPAFAHARAREWIITIVATVIFVALYFAIFWVKRPFCYVLLICMAAMGIGLAPINQGSSVFIIFCSSFIPWVFGNTKRSVIALLTLLAIVGI